MRIADCKHCGEEITYDEQSKRWAHKLGRIECRVLRPVAEPVYETVKIRGAAAETMGTHR